MNSFISSVSPSFVIAKAKGEGRLFRRTLSVLVALAAFFLFSGSLFADAKTIFRKHKSSIFIVRVQSGGKPLGSGSAFIASYGGKRYVVTNRHVIEDGDEIYLEQNKKKYRGVKVLRTGAWEDLALLTFPEIDQFPSVDIKPYKPEEGEKVYVMGFPGVSQELRLTITEGIVSNSRWLLKNEIGQKFRYVQISAAVNSGNSGGPVFGEKGDLLGVATIKGIKYQLTNGVVPVKALIQEIVFHVKKDGYTAAEKAMLLNRTIALVARHIYRKDWVLIGKMYTDEAKKRVFPDALRSLERVHHAMLLAVILKNPARTGGARANDGKTVRFLKRVATRLRNKQDFYVLMMYAFSWGRGHRGRITEVVKSPERTSSLYLSGVFARKYYSASGSRGGAAAHASRSGKSKQGPRMEVSETTFNADRTRARATLILTLPKKRPLRLPLRFVLRGGNWKLTN